MPIRICACFETRVLQLRGCIVPPSTGAGPIYIALPGPLCNRALDEGLKGDIEDEHPNSTLYGGYRIILMTRFEVSTMKGVSLCLQLILAIAQVYFLCRSTLISPNTAHLCWSDAPSKDTQAATVAEKAANLSVGHGLDFAVIGFPKTGECFYLIGFRHVTVFSHHR